MLLESAAPGWLTPILARLDPEQRAAATLPDGPAQIIAPAGSGKTTTMVARLAVLLARGVPAAELCVVTFNRDAAADLAARVATRLGPVAEGAEGIEIRTLHALARQVLLDAGDASELIADRLPLLRAARRTVQAAKPDAVVPDATVLDGWRSASRIEGREPPADCAEVLAAYEVILRARGALDFDDLVVRACELMEMDLLVRRRWQSRYAHVCVDEFQDVDAAQLRLVRLLAAPQDNLFVVGDDDQTIYAWRLADVRRILAFGTMYPAARRVMLATNYRCPRPVVERSAALIAANRERFVKPIRPSPAAEPATDSIIAWSTATRGWADRMAAFAAGEDRADRSCCFLTRTRAELAPVMLALVRAGVRHTGGSPPVVESPALVALLEDARRSAAQDNPFHVLRRLRAARGWLRSQETGDMLADDEHAAMDALLGWSVGYRSCHEFVRACDDARARIAALRDPTARVELATVHGSKGREWQTVVIVGFEEDRMPNRRSLLDAEDPARALEEERRLAYVALTRATGRLVLAFDPARPSPFLAEIGLATGAGRYEEAATAGSRRRGLGDGGAASAVPRPSTGRR